MPIAPTDPVVIPPAEERIVDRYWVSHLSIEGRTAGGDSSVSFSLLPYNSTSGKSFPDLMVPVTIKSLAQLLAERPDLAGTVGAAFDALLDAISAVAKEVGAIA